MYMTGKMKAIVCVLLSFLTCLTCVGYASVSDELRIEGHAEYSLPMIYISNVSVYGGNGSLESENHLIKTILHSKIHLTSSASSSLILAVTVKNRSQDVYGYNATIVSADTAAYDNQNIGFGIYSNAACTSRLKQKTAVYPESTAQGADGLTFYVEFTYQDGYRPSAAESLTSYLNFDFKTPIDSIIEDAAVNNAVDQFHDILNDHINDKDLNPLINAMNSAGSDRNISYIGNVSGAAETDVNKVEALFDGQLKVNIEGEDKEVKFLLKRENIDGNTATGGTDPLIYEDQNGDQNVVGWEMVMYMTTESLTGGGWLSSTYRTVYAIVFTSYDGGSTWEQLGEMYKGEARVYSYNGWPGNGSFSTDTWRSTVSYYGLSTRQSIETLIANIPQT